MNTISIGLVVIILISVSLQLFSSPDLTNPLIPERTRIECGYRYRPLISNISFADKCFKKSIPHKVLVSQPIVPQRIPTTRVKDGRPVQYREAPWDVRLTLPEVGSRGAIARYTTKCTGALITPRYILTAAHCYKPFLVLFIGEDTVSTGRPIEFFDYSIHPNYTQNNTYKAYYDIAILRLRTPIDLDYENSDRRVDPHLPGYSPLIYRVNTICLPREYDLDPPPNTPIDRFEDSVFYGWGYYRESILPRRLQRGDMPVRYYDPDIDQRFWFISRDTGTKTCQGDSGGGVVQYLDEYETRAVLIGLVNGAMNRTDSMNPRCTEEFWAESWVLRVAKHINWIYEQIREGEEHNTR